MKKTVLISFLLVAAYFFALVYSAFQKYSWKEMDWNEDGSTSFSEILSSTDIGKREIEIKGSICKEYFAYKDGLPIKKVCGIKA